MRARNYYRKRPSPWPRRILAALLTGMLAYAAVSLIRYGVQQQQSRAIQEELQAAICTEMPVDTPIVTAPPAAQEQNTPAFTSVPRPSATPTLEPWRTPEILFAYQSLYEKNNDLIGWLKMDRLYRVDFAVVQRDQAYYLRRDFYGKSNMNGTAFLDAANRIWPRDDNLIIYAHNMKSGEMFGELKKLMNEVYYREAPLTRFNTIYERGTYVPVAVVLCTVAQGDEFFNFYTRSFRNAAEFNRFIDRARELSKVHPPYDVRYGDDLLTLVTCYDDADTQRLVVILRRVRDDEDPAVLAVRWK
ncbi:MAG: class B sortase [Clostridia bacterium]|nr:class B sortase [Clostridia bacterium]